MFTTAAELAKKYKATYKSIRKAIEKYDRIVVFRHIKPDFDAFGSQMGLVTFLKDNFPNKEIHFVGDSHPIFSGHLFPEDEDINVEWFSNPFLAIVVDVGDKKRIADPRYEMGETIIKFDHHPAETDITPLKVVELEAGSASELVANFCLNWKGKKMSPEAARNFFIGIVGDTGRFMYPSSGSHSMEIATELLRTGFDFHETYLEMYEKDVSDLAYRGYLYTHYAISEHGVAYYTLPSKAQEELGLTAVQGKDGVNIFSNLKGVNAWCSITEDPDPKDYCWRVSIRSKHDDISGIARQFGGGGHKNAAGARIDSLDDLPKLIKALDDLFA